MAESNASSNDRYHDQRQRQRQRQRHRRSLIRVLCLHDTNSNAEELYKLLYKLDERLYTKHGIEFVYVNAPLLVPRMNEENDSISALQRVWWKIDEDKEIQQESREENYLDTSLLSPCDFDDTIKEVVKNSTYTGLDASLMLLQQIWHSSAPMHGILGFGSGGAAVASLFTLLPNLLPPPYFAIFSHGSTILPEENQTLITIPSLHLVNTETYHQYVSSTHDTHGSSSSSSSNSNNDLTVRLIRQFGGYGRGEETDEQLHNQQHVFVHEQQTTTLSSMDFNVIGRFLVAQIQKSSNNSNKNNTCEGDIGRLQTDIITLQNHLYYAERDAATLIARYIATTDKPPAALMAVIQPTDMNVANWNNIRERPLGGGAPCPSEFLLHRTKRYAGQQQRDGASRVHPDVLSNEEE